MCKTLFSTMSNLSKNVLSTSNEEIILSENVKN